jgi:hypothetical protein
MHIFLQGYPEKSKKTCGFVSGGCGRSMSEMTGKAEWGHSATFLPKSSHQAAS